MNHLSRLLSNRLPFFYGYIIVVVAVLTQICSSPGQTFAISAFTPYFQESLGLSASRLAAAYMLGTFLAALPLSLIGPLSDRIGLRATTVLVATALSASCWLMSNVSGFYSLTVAFLMLRCLGQGAMTLLGSNIVSMWFRDRLGTVNSVMSIGGSIAFAAIPLLLIWSTARFGWRETYVGMGIVIFVSLVPALLVFLRNRPEELGQRPDGKRLHASIDEALVSLPDEPEFNLGQAIRHRTFWILATGMAVWAMIGTGIVFYALPIFEAQGVPSERSKLLFTTFSAAMLAAQVVGGVLADRLPMNRLLAAGFLLLAAGAAVVPVASSEWLVHGFALLFGAGQGMTIAVSSTMWVRYYGRKHLGKIRGMVWSMIVAGSGCGPFILGLFHDNFGSFTPGLWVFTGLMLPLAPLSLYATALEVPDPSELAPLKPESRDPITRPELLEGHLPMPEHQAARQHDV